MARALIGMSGGVDSSAAACLLMDMGYECVGATMQLHDAAAAQIADARAVCSRLGMEFCVLDLQQAFRDRVQSHFVAAYEAGLTPNPCIECNKHIKFGLFWEAAQKMGCSHIATGHYARIVATQDGYALKKAPDEQKDQSYFLYGIPRALLGHILFPLGALSKAEARALAERAGLPTARKKDSQDICFVPDGDYMTFLQRFTGREYDGGSYLDLQGQVVGQHKGAVAYTIGQRKGLGIALGAPVYVCRKDMAQNTVTVGPDAALYASGLLADDFNWLSPAPIGTLRCTAKARSRMKDQPATVTDAGNGCYRVEFDTPQRAITPGQAVVLYDGDTVLGGGTITKTI